MERDSRTIMRRCALEFLAFCLVAGCQADCGPWDGHGPRQAPYVPPVTDCVVTSGSNPCSQHDAGATTTCFQQTSQLNYIGRGLCLDRCEAWSESLLVANARTSERVCLGASGTTIDVGASGPESGLWFVRCFPEDPPGENLECRTVTYGSSTVNVYLAKP